MANLSDTQLLAAIARASNQIQDSGEFRDYDHSAVKLLLMGENDVFRDLNAMKQADSQPTKVDLNKKVYTASGSAKSASHSAAAFPDSFVKDITYLRKTQTFKVSNKQADGNRLTYESILHYEMKNKLQSLYLDLSTEIVAWLNTNRTEVATSSILTFDGVNFKFDNSLTDLNLFFEYLKSSMKKNKYNATFDIAGDQRIASLYRQLAANGRTNADNTEFQLPGINMVEEPQMSIVDGGQCFAWQRGMVGMTTWNELLNRRGSGSVGNNEGLFTTMTDPIFGFELDLHVKRNIVDTSGAVGNVQDIVDEYELAITYALEGTWESTADASHIFKFLQANS